MSADDYRSARQAIINIIKPDNIEENKVPTEQEAEKLIDQTIDNIFNLQPRWKETVDRKILLKDLLQQMTVLFPDKEVIFKKSEGSDHKEWFEDKWKEGKIKWNYYKRYQEYLEYYSDMPPLTISKLDRLTTKIIEQIEDPERDDTSWDIRGSVIGQVQSGKTANYIGLINKALDAGYKRIIILCGLNNDLRSQTQQRIEEGVTGRAYSQSAGLQNFKVGVGNINNFSDIDGKVQLCTTRDDNGDFNTTRARSFQPSDDTPVILIIKKNVSVLENVLLWILKYESQNTWHEEKDPWEWRQRLKKDIESIEIDNRKTKVPRVKNRPVLLIDDECDQASIDTNLDTDMLQGEPDPEHDPTLTNKLIRRILDAYDKSVYVGYTATPYANVFIDPRLKSKQAGKDIFPEDFIINLPAPSSYIGPAQIFSDIEKKSNVINSISDYLDEGEDPNDRAASGWMPPRHDINHIPQYKNQNELPTSLKEAIISFLISCAVRKLRGYDKGNSMLVHVSRFVSVSERAGNQIQEFINDLESINVGNFSYESLIKEIWDSKFTNHINDNFNFDKNKIKFDDVYLIIQQSLQTNKTVVELVNGSALSKSEYDKSLKANKNIIAVGGQRLSRGLTLKSLMISYFLRTARRPLTDTMTQMGRWFGYRPNYSDLCKLYITDELEQNFRDFAIADYEFRNKIEEMNEQERTPKNYQLMVQRDPNYALSSRNKLHYTSVVRLDFSDYHGQTIVLHKDNSSEAKNNRDSVRDLVLSLNKPDQNRENKNNCYLWKKTESKKIIKFLQKYKTHENNTKIHTESFIDYIQRMNNYGELKFWSVGIISKTSTEDKVRLIHNDLVNFPVNCMERSPNKKNKKTDDKNTHTIGILDQEIDESFDLNNAEYNAAIEKWELEDGRRLNKSKRFYYRWARGRAYLDNYYQDIENDNYHRGQLLIYPIINPKEPKKDQLPMIGITITFPGLSTNDSREVIMSNFQAERIHE
ncbi:MAG: hypothetical protein CFH22_00954 [Alphaproteobacteria bacterium MarineAlpha5_Bin12]|nr:hypothetical protein [Candidatus Neomarinimicrobiota bacterium]PPR41270.1 MAG: hypothetical protein CFH22_00954 [Alphaproteobacteria bacterium MarineAlpha5_Bin12]|tara:strand:- start:8600 stop:11545 length:2946 start_codon:yes stop_codon:yes gene_type:complete